VLSHGRKELCVLHAAVMVVASQGYRVSWETLQVYRIEPT
jgi:hypothetical protein